MTTETTETTETPEATVETPVKTKRAPRIVKAPKKPFKGYAATEDKTEDGQVIYHKRTGGKGRPAQFVKPKGRYVGLKTYLKSL